MRPLLVVSCLAVLACGAVIPAYAGFPPYYNSTVPPLIPVVGRDATGVPDPLGEITIVVRDLANNPVPNSSVLLDFTDCTELRLCANAHQPGVIVDCATRRVMGLTDVNGRVLFRVTGWSTATPGTPGAPYNSAKVYADGVLLARPSVAIYDLDTGGLGASDLSALLADFFAGFNEARGDYDNSGGISAADLAKWLKVYFTGGSVSNCTPEGPCP